MDEKFKKLSDLEFTLRLARHNLDVYRQRVANLEEVISRTEGEIAELRK